jgi:hypothetical protein
MVLARRDASRYLGMLGGTPRTSLPAISCVFGRSTGMVLPAGLGL